MSTSISDNTLDSKFARAAYLMRRIDAALDHPTLSLKRKVLTSMELAKSLCVALRPFEPGTWQSVDEALGAVPLNNNNKINDLININFSGAIPNWCIDWMRQSRISGVA